MLEVEGAWRSLEKGEKLGKVWKMYMCVEEKIGKNKKRKIYILLCRNIILMSRI